jgi:FkbM family methyltransferase
VSYAQFGEDMILLNLFHQLGIERPSYLDVGAHHPLNCSNTALLYARGSRGLCVEANPNLIQAFRDLRPGDVKLNIGVGPQAGELDFYMIDDWSGRNTFDRKTAQAFVAAHPEFEIHEIRKIPVLTLDQIVADHCAGAWPDLLSLDAEGLDAAILKASGFSADHGPKMICVEAISGDDVDQGAELDLILTGKGYAKVAQTLGNMIWQKNTTSPGR